VAVDRSLSQVRQQELRDISTRARITGSSFVKRLRVGDLKADPRALMDATSTRSCTWRTLGYPPGDAAVPVGLADPQVAAEYCLGDAASSWTAPSTCCWTW
jgi:hypothetical protein